MDNSVTNYDVLEADWILKQQIAALYALQGARITYVSFGSLGLDLYLDTDYRVYFTDAWKIELDQSVKIGSGDVVPMHNVDEPSWQSEIHRVRKRLAFLIGDEIINVYADSEQVLLELRSGCYISSFNVKSQGSFWSVQTRKGDQDFVWWKPIVDAAKQEL